MTLDPNLYGLLSLNLEILKAECAKIRMEIPVLTYNQTHASLIPIKFSGQSILFLGKWSIHSKKEKRKIVNTNHRFMSI